VTKDMQKCEEKIINDIERKKKMNEVEFVNPAIKDM
jgi:hypothetical protein